jgi:hypothetical protein
MVVNPRDAAVRFRQAAADGVIPVAPERVYDGGMPLTLDEAWAEAEAALPPRWVMWKLAPDAWKASVADIGVDRVLHSWEAQAAGPIGVARGHGPTPAAALHALAVALQSQEAGE